MKNKNDCHPDLYFEEKSVTSRFSELLKPAWHNCTMDQIMDAAVEILNMKDTNVSDHKRKEYIMKMEQKYSKLALNTYICNIVMKGSNLSMHQ